MSALLLAGLIGGALLCGKWLRRRREAHKLTLTPLAGFDTGARSPFRTPRGVRFHRGL